VIPIKETAEGVVFHVQVLPKSSKRQITGLQGDFLKIKITAPPVDGRANEECIRLDIKKDQVHIVGGLNAKKKTVSIKGLQKKDVEALILSVLAPL